MQVYIASPLTFNVNNGKANLEYSSRFSQIEGLDTESDGSSPFPHVGYIEGMWVGCMLPICEDVFAKQSCPVRSLKSATASILGQSGMSESATVHCFSFVRALSLHCVERHRQNRCPLLNKCVNKLIAFNGTATRNPL
ncbi:unnamed protein product [Rodentolepis nana]|uniref:FZ domain-containing protein n=1 Tax=Rodentolepis nana TaxID=102285 RepID=A0A0R3TJH3_RODNA|nr:unnamed protein product [Rodentolepis nana]